MTTLDLALKLGLVETIIVKPTENVKIHGEGQKYSHLVVLDFESTCWEQDHGFKAEIIEFPAVLMNTATGEIEDEFQYYVKPGQNPHLSEFCKTFTGIPQDAVDNGVSLASCLGMFTQWLQKNSDIKGINFNGTGVGPKLATIVTWTNWDLGTCLEQECRQKHLNKPLALCKWLDLKAMYKRFYSRVPQGLNRALEEVGLIFEGREHCGLDDARNTSRLAWKMICDGCIL